ncbi:unnamed protein product [Peniophora sp. CBMAI 1063]|nr:unnamed protein product [Peniophora sp. CBMAI 1063]
MSALFLYAPSIVVASTGHDYVGLTAPGRRFDGTLRLPSTTEAVLDVGLVDPLLPALPMSALFLYTIPVVVAQALAGGNDYVRLSESPGLSSSTEVVMDAHPIQLAATH